MTVLIIVLAIVMAVILWGVSMQRKLVSLDELCGNAMSQIGVQQESRWDAISSLVDLTKSYNKHEYETLMAVIAQRKDIDRGSSAEEANAQENAISGVLSQIKLVAEQYPQLKADGNYAKTMDSVNLYENQVRTSRMVFNDSVTKFNRAVRQFPDSVIAGMLRFKVRDYLKEPGEKTAMPKINI